MNCRKCGNRHLGKNPDKLYTCRHCGVQPTLQSRDRFGNLLPNRTILESNDVCREASQEGG